MTEIRVASVLVFVFAVALVGLMVWRVDAAGHRDARPEAVAGSAGGQDALSVRHASDRDDDLWRSRLAFQGASEPTATITLTPTATNTPTPTHTSTPTVTSTPVLVLQPPTRIGVVCEWLEEDAVKATVSWQNQHDQSQWVQADLRGYNIRYVINGFEVGEYLTIEDSTEEVTQVLTVYHVSGSFEGEFRINNIYGAMRGDQPGGLFYGPQASGTCTLPAYNPPTVTHTPTLTGTPTTSPTLRASEVSVSNLAVDCSREGDDTVQVATSWNGAPSTTGAGDLVGYGVNLLVGGSLHTEHTVGSNEESAYFTYRPIDRSQTFSALVQVYPKYRNANVEVKGRLSSRSCLLPAQVSTSTPRPTDTPRPTGTPGPMATDTPRPTDTPVPRAEPESTDTPTATPAEVVPPAPDTLEVSCVRGDPDSELNINWRAPDAVLADLTLNHYRVLLDLDGQSAFEAQVSTTSYTRRLHILRADATPAIGVRVSAVYTDGDSREFRSADITGSCVIEAVSAARDTATPTDTPPPGAEPESTNTPTTTPAEVVPPAPDSLNVSCVRGDPDSELNITWRAPNAVLADLTLNHYRVLLDLDGQGAFEAQVSTTSYTRRLHILRADATPAIGVRVRAVYTDGDSREFRSADVSGSCVFDAVSAARDTATPTNTATPAATWDDPGITLLPPATLPPGHTQVPPATLPPGTTPAVTVSPSECRGLSVRATRPEPGSVSDLILEPAPPNCTLPAHLVAGAEVTVSLPEDLEVPLSFEAGDVLLIAGRRYQPGWIDVSDVEGGRTEILLLNCHSWRVPGRVEAGVCHEAGRVSRVELDKVRLPRRPATADEPYEVMLRWASAGTGAAGQHTGGQLSGRLVMRAGLSLDEDQVGWGERVSIAATGFAPGLTVRFYAEGSTGRVDCDDAEVSDWEEIGSTGADRRGRASLTLRVDREFRSVGEHQICARDGAGTSAARSVELLVRPGLELPGGSSLSYTQGDVITIRLLPETDNFRVEGVRVDGREVNDWRQRGSDLELTLPAASGDMVPIRVEFEDGGAAEVRINLSERELQASSLEGLTEPVLLGGRMLLRTSGLGGEEVCRVYFEDVRIAILDDDDLDRDGCVRVSRQGSVELTAAMVSPDGEVLTELVRAVMSAGDTGELTVEDDDGGRSSTMAAVAAPEVDVSIPGEEIAKGDVITVNGRNFPPDRGYLTQPAVRIDFGGRTRHVDYVETDWEHELTLSERQQGGVLIEVFVLIDGYRLPGAAARHRVAVSSVVLEAVPDTVRMGERIKFKVSGLPGYTAGYRLQVQDGIFLDVDGKATFATDEQGSFEGETELPSEYQDYLLEDKRTRVLIQLYQGQRIIPSALATVHITSEVLNTATPTPPTPRVRTVTPVPTVDVERRPTPVVIVLGTPTVAPVAPTPTPGIIILDAPTPTPDPDATPFIIMLPAPTAEGGLNGLVTPTPFGDGAATFDIPTVEPLPTREPDPTATLPPTLPPPPTRDEVEIARTLTAQVQAELEQGEREREEEERKEREEREERERAEAEARATEEENSLDGSASDERDEDERDERDDEEEEDDEGGMFGLSSRNLVGVLLVGVLLAALGAGWYFYRRYQAQQFSGENPEQDPGDGQFADFLAQQEAAQAAQQEAGFQQQQQPPGSPAPGPGPGPGPEPGQGPGPDFAPDFGPDFGPEPEVRRGPETTPADPNIPTVGLDEDSQDWTLGEGPGPGRPPDSV